MEFVRVDWQVTGAAGTCRCSLIGTHGPAEVKQNLGPGPGSLNVRIARIESLGSPSAVVNVCQAVCTAIDGLGPALAESSAITAGQTMHDATQIIAIAMPARRRGRARRQPPSLE